MKINIILGYTIPNMETYYSKYIKPKYNKQGKINFPESSSHPKTYIKVLWKTMKRYMKEPEIEAFNILTFSEIILNMIGYLINIGILNNENVCIYIVENKNESKMAFYDEEGYTYGDLPFGFFSYEHDFYEE